VAARGRPHAVGSVAEEDLVEVDLEDRRLAEPRLHPQRQDRLSDLSLERTLLIVEEALGDLLGDRRAALHDGARLKIGPQRTSEPAKVEASVLVKAAILGRQERLDQRLG